MTLLMKENIKKITKLSQLKNISPKQLDLILDYKVELSDAGAESVREYFYLLLKTLYDEGEGFNSKRPFGNSSWELDIFTAFVKMKAVEGKLDEWNYLDDYDENICNALVFKLIDYIFHRN